MLWTYELGSCAIKYSVASLGFIKYVRICCLMWLSEELCDKFAIFHKCIVRNLGLKNFAKAGGWVTSWIQISCLPSLCPFHCPTSDPRSPWSSPAEGNSAFHVWFLEHQQCVVWGDEKQCSSYLWRWLQFKRGLLYLTQACPGYTWVYAVSCSATCCKDWISKILRSKWPHE